ncbi:substrate-binding domain-containing protein [Bradyrhizobium ontarionense]|uniref:Substrate-binding domain-containing protein n=1 Tax=Bradyrhizobium ontarionense TaxID=2898149 RepID=A0ABY3R7L6_9BRAD|nr:substrate-binding domain-containing protein [Bradyrhizobium sp. A19]UFZ03323.1 substrate-binding domain-containing protein [Bradyrhizobium sp. A19]
MTTRSSISRLRCTASVLVLSTAATFAAAVQPAAAQTAVYGGGSTLVSLAMRQAMDCYNAQTVTSDGYSFSTGFDATAPTPGLLPQTADGANCSQLGALGTVGLYAAVGSGAGQRAFITNDPKQLLRGSAPTLSLPAVPPVFLESGVPALATYPYARVDFGAGDSPLPSSPTNTPSVTALTNFSSVSNWQNQTNITASNASSATAYNAAAFGPAVQLPMIEAPVAIVVNTNSTPTATWTINSAGTAGTPGSAIQLSTAQLCAIFSGEVRDWSSTAAIAALDNVGQARVQTFMDDNTGNGGAAQAYVSNSLPIQVAFRSDGSGTSFILTNFLANSCPQLDADGSHNYAKIFTGVGVTFASTVVTLNDQVTGTTTTTTIAAKTNASAVNLPSTTFANLIANIKAVKGVDVSTGAGGWLAGNGTGEVADTVNSNAQNANGNYLGGRIGYVSNDFAKPYNPAASGPLSASVQNDDQRARGVYHPGDQGENFIAPTPASADLAFQSVTVPTGTDYASWNLYNQTYAGVGQNAGVTVDGKSQLGLPITAGAYPITGTTFAYLYSCYNTTSAPTRVADITNFLTWFYSSQDAASVLQNNGFNALNASFATQIKTSYLTSGSGVAIAASSTQADGCSTVAAGAGAQ